MKAQWIRPIPCLSQALPGSSAFCKWGLTLSVVINSACTAPGLTEADQRDGIETFVEQHQSVVELWLSKGEYQRALVHLEALRLIDTKSPEIKEQLQQLSNQQRQISDELLRQGETELKKHRQHAAKVYLLRSLAVDPGNLSSRLALRELYREEIKHELESRKKSISLKRTEYEASKAIPAASLDDPLKPGADEKLESYRQLFDDTRYSELIDQISSDNKKPYPIEIVEVLRAAHRQLAIQFQQSGHFDRALAHAHSAAFLSVATERDTELLKAIRQGISHHLFEEGKGLLRTDIDAAVRLMEKALSYDPENLDHQVFLRRAQKMRDNFREIQAE
ncbi:hypothetical protein OLMES_1537 [Oleiphilus messinensis]|uniref:Tetratricopeptide repeat protein n=1 Tax=Oleiphilus messinensis TaxID=141451 RepID=A0A1Y0I558_9GAMM|nr:hypothetical protein [Oleiphilus messinensis]ARU55612.1 hypothetical protein OLMES_1537 [Oleiphilus messinensis]